MRHVLYLLLLLGVLAYSPSEANAGDRPPADDAGRRLFFIKRYIQDGVEREKIRRCVAKLIEKHPGSEEARIAADLMADTSLPADRSGTPTPAEIRRYIRESDAQLQLKLARIQYGRLSEQQKRVASAELTSKPYFGYLQLAGPNIGQMGLLAPQSEARAFRILDSQNMLVDVWWRDDETGVGYQRLFWITGIATEGLKEGSTVPLPGVFQVVERKSFSGDYRTNGGDVFVLSPVDVSQEIQRVFRDRQNRASLIRNRERIRSATTSKDQRDAQLDEIMRRGPRYRVGGSRQYGVSGWR